MADFITNTTGDKAVRKNSIKTIEIVHVVATEFTPEHFGIMVYSDEIKSSVMEFETDTTEAGIQTKMDALLDLFT